MSQDAESAAINVKEGKRSAVRDAQPWKSPSGAVSAVLNPAARQKLNHCGECPDFPCEMEASMGTDMGFDAEPRLKQCREWAK